MDEFEDVSAIPPPFARPAEEPEPVTFEDWERERISSAIGVVCTLGSDGFPHAAPVQISLEDDSILFESDVGSRKHRNIVADPRVCVCVFGSPKWGVVVQGRAEILSEGGPRNQAQFKITPVRKASWRRKEG
ncbi:MAG: pyridoxamine 5'-phosphate oxidase family protein [Actinomycetota bacterium]|nr:pyridoxamine 5'-phosphate oxidase family protein [Actinomycetota bacterium]